MNPNTRSALRNYLSAGMLCCLVAVGALFLEQPKEMVLFKVLLAPVFWLAFLGLEGIFRVPVYEGRFTLRALEYSALTAFVWMPFGICLSWNYESVQPVQLLVIPILFLIATALVLCFGLWRSAA